MACGHSRRVPRRRENKTNQGIPLPRRRGQRHLQEKSMRCRPLLDGYRNPLRFSLIAFSCVALLGFGVSSGQEQEDEGAAPLTVPKATCGANDHPETGLQGQVPAALRAAGFQGFNCNLQLIGQSKGDGANWQSTEFRDEQGHVCAYHGTSFREIAARRNCWPRWPLARPMEARGLRTRSEE